MSSLRRILPTTIHTFKKRITNPWSGKVIKANAPSLYDVVQNYTLPKESKQYNESFESIKYIQKENSMPNIADKR